MIRRLAVVLVLGGLAGVGLYFSQRYLDNPASDINRFVPSSWLTKSRLGDIASHFPLTTTETAAPRALHPPPADQLVPARTETALFALG